MNRIDTASLRNRLLASLIISMALIMLLIAAMTAWLQESKKSEMHSSYLSQVRSSIEHTIHHYVEDYTYRARRFIETTKVTELLKTRDRKAIYELLAPKWELMKEEEHALNIMHIHLADGTSFLRFHQPHVYGDAIADKRPMVKAMHKRQQILSGYETGPHGLMYRVMVPIVDDEKHYLGFLEIGLNPGFLLSAVEEITGYKGLVFIKASDLKLYSEKESILIDGFRLQSAISPEQQPLIETLKQAQSLHDNHIVRAQGDEYLLHVMNTKDFNNETKVKLVFFQNLSYAFFKRNEILLFFGTVIAVLMALLTWYFNRRILKYEEGARGLYEEKMFQLHQSQQQLQRIFDLTPQIMFLTDGNKLVKANQALLDFFNYKNYESFNQEHVCISDYFDNEAGALRKQMHGTPWLEYVLQHPKKLHKAVISNADQKYIFNVRAIRYQLGSQSYSLVVLSDITEVETLKERYEYAISGANDGLWDWNLESNKVYFSNVWKAQIGYAPDELPNDLSSWSERVHPDDYNQAITDIQKSHVTPGVPYKNIHRLRHKEGDWVWILDRGTTLFNSEGKAYRMIGFHTDISEYKALEQRLVESQQQFESFMENLPAFVTMKDKEGRITYASNKTAQFFNKDSLVGLKAADLFDTYYARLLHVMNQKVLRHGYMDEVVPFVNERQETRYFRIMTFLIHNEKGPYIGTLYIDITKQYLSQIEVKRLQGIIDEAPVSVFITDPEGNIEYINSFGETLTQYRLAELKGKTPRVFKSGETTSVEYQKIWKQISSGNVWSGTFKNLKKDGTIFWERTFIAPITDDSGTIINYLSIQQEISEEMRLREELLEQEQLMISQSRHAAMGEMIGMIAHQWRQPIASIAMGANSIIADVDLEEGSDDAYRRQAYIILKQTDYLSKTIDDFRNFFRPNKEKERVDINAVLDEAMEIIGKSLEHAQIHTEISAQELQAISTYSREVLQVFINIIKNAKEALMEGREAQRRIDITMEQTSDLTVTIKICDNAGGISEAIIEKIFDPYFSTKDEKTGTGLGLYMSKTIVDKHLHGSIGVTNTSQGACFHVSIPHLK